MYLNLNPNQKSNRQVEQRKMMVVVDVRPERDDRMEIGMGYERG